MQVWIVVIESMGEKRNQLRVEPTTTEKLFDRYDWKIYPGDESSIVYGRMSRIYRSASNGNSAAYATRADNVSQLDQFLEACRNRDHSWAFADNLPTSKTAPEKLPILESWYARSEASKPGLPGRTVLCGLLNGEALEIPMSAIHTANGRNISALLPSGNIESLTLGHPHDDYLKYISRFCYEKWDPNHPIRLETEE